MKAVVAAFNQEKALVGAFSVITTLRMELFEALTRTRGPAVSIQESPPVIDILFTEVLKDSKLFYFMIYQNIYK